MSDEEKSKKMTDKKKSIKKSMNKLGNLKKPKNSDQGKNSESDN